MVAPTLSPEPGWEVNYWQQSTCFTMKASAKEIAFHQNSRATIQASIAKLADAVGLTLGPRGRNVVLDEFGNPRDD